MGKTQITLNANAFIKSLNKSLIEDNRKMMALLSTSMDNIRFRAGRKYIIPRKGVKPSDKQGWIALYKRQPIDRKKLTQRSSFLKILLASPGLWSRSLKVMRLKAGPHLVFWIKPQKIGKRFMYLAQLAIMPKGSKAVKERIKHELKGARKSRIKRPFFEPAINDEKKVIANNISVFLRKLKTI